MNIFKKIVEKMNTKTKENTSSKTEVSLDYGANTQNHQATALATFYILSRDPDMNQTIESEEELWPLDHICYFLWNEIRISGKVDIYFNGFVFSEYDDFVQQVIDINSVFPDSRLTFFIRDVQSMKEFGYSEELLSDYDYPNLDILYAIPIKVQVKIGY